jgi:cell division protein FtsL
MIRMVNLFLGLGCAVALVAVYGLKYQAEATAGELKKLEISMAAKKNQLWLLKADWAYLNQPSAIEPIVVRHAEALGIEPITAAQFGTIEQVPLRPAEIDPLALEALLLSLEAGLDPATGLISER